MKKISILYFHRSWIYILYVLVVFIAGCAGSAEEKKENPETKQQSKPILPQKKLSPGTAKVEGHIIKFEKEDTQYLCIFRVDKVLGYGMSVKPIGKGTDIYMYISSDQEEFVRLLSEGTMEQKYELTIEQELMVDNQLKCRALKIEKKYFEQ